MGIAIKRYLKQADWLGRPKWAVDPNWDKDEAAVNDWYEQIDAELSGMGNRSLPATSKAYAMDPKKYLDLTTKHNLYVNRHNATSMGFLDRARGALPKKVYDQYRRADRNLALSNLENDLDYILTRPSADAKLTPKGKELLKLWKDVSAYLDKPEEEQNKEPVPKEIAALYKPTSYQLKRWQAQANNNGDRARRNALIGAAIGGGIGSLGGLGLSFIPATSPIAAGLTSGSTGTNTSTAPSQVMKSLLGAGIFGGLGAGIGGLAGYLDTSQYDRHRKQYAKKKLSEYA